MLWGEMVRVRERRRRLCGGAPTRRRTRAPSRATAISRSSPHTRGEFARGSVRAAVASHARRSAREVREGGGGGPGGVVAGRALGGEGGVEDGIQARACASGRSARVSRAASASGRLEAMSSAFASRSVWELRARPAGVDESSWRERTREATSAMRRDLRGCAEPRASGCWRGENNNKRDPAATCRADPRGARRVGRRSRRAKRSRTRRDERRDAEGGAGAGVTPHVEACAIPKIGHDELDAMTTKIDDMPVRPAPRVRKREETIFASAPRLTAFHTRQRSRRARPRRRRQIVEQTMGVDVLSAFESRAQTLGASSRDPGRPTVRFESSFVDSKRRARRIPPRLGRF